MEGYKGSHPTEQRDALMSKRRMLLINLIITFLIAGSLFCIIFDKEYWPFSQYPMFSKVQTDYSLSGLRLYGVPQEEPHHEFSLLAYSYTKSYAYMEPFDQIRLDTALRKMERKKRKPEKRDRLLNGALLGSLERYEQLRLAGRHDGPPLQGMRLYELEWHLDSWASNVERPDHRELIAEVEQQSDD